MDMLKTMQKNEITLAELFRTQFSMCGRPIFRETLLRVPAASAPRTRRILFPMSMSGTKGRVCCISVHVLEYALATLIEGVASALRHQLFEHASHCFYSVHQMVELSKLSLGERSPAF